MTFLAVLCHMEKAILLFLAQHLSSLIAKILLGSDERNDALAMEYGCKCAISAWRADVKPNPASIGASTVKADAFALPRLMLSSKFFHRYFPGQAVPGLTSGAIVFAVPLPALKG